MSHFADIFATYPAAALFAVAMIAVVAGMARGFSGFGGAMIFMPLASLIIGPKVAAPLLMIVDFIGTSPTIPQALRLGEKKPVMAMVVASLISVPLGAAMLVHLDPVAVRWAISVIVFLLLALLISGYRYAGRLGFPALFSTGLVAGFLGGLAQIAGPPVVALWLGSSRPHAIARANIMLYFTLSSLVTFSTYLLGGLFSRDILLLAVIVEPAYLIGVLAGMRLFPLADPKLFRLVSYLLIAIAAITGLPILSA